MTEPEAIVFVVDDDDLLDAIGQAWERLAQHICRSDSHLKLL